MANTHAGPALADSETSLEDPNARVVVVGQVLCILVPLIVWSSRPPRSNP